MAQQLDDIVEVVEAGQFQANMFLRAKYRLMAVLPGSSMTKHKESPQWYVRHGVVYVLGRPDGVPHVEYAPKSTLESDKGS